MTPFPPRFGRALAFVVLSGAVVATVLGVGLPPSGAATHRIVPSGSIPTAKQLITETKKTMSNESSVRVTITSSDKSTKQSETVTEDAGKTNGLESIVFGTATTSVRFTSKAAYVSGNAAGLEKIVGLSTKGAKAVGSKWIVVNKGSTQFTNIVAGGTIGPLTTNLFPSSSTKSVKVTSDKLNGHNVFAMKWTATENSAKVDLALDIATSGTKLPLELTATQGSLTSVTQFGRWNEHINVSVPTSTIAYSKVPS